MSRANANPNKIKCEFCGKVDPPHNAEFKKIGTHLGDSGTLGGNIMAKHYTTGTAKNHPLSGNGRYDSAQAHHLIACAAMKKGWEKICSSFGYDINHHNNGVFLPSDMHVACELGIPLHRGSHGRIEPGTESASYTDAVKQEIIGIKNGAESGDDFYCNNEKEIINALNNKSKVIWDEIISFNWKLTSDGGDYQSKGVGCLGHKSIPGKRSFTKNRKLSDIGCRRSHEVVIVGSYFVERGQSKTHP